jgi:hypothetical protein
VSPCVVPAVHENTKMNLKNKSLKRDVSSHEDMQLTNAKRIRFYTKLFTRMQKEEEEKKKEILLHDAERMKEVSPKNVVANVAVVGRWSNCTFGCFISCSLAGIQTCTESLVEIGKGRRHHEPPLRRDRPTVERVAGRYVNFFMLHVGWCTLTACNT